MNEPLMRSLRYPLLEIVGFLVVGLLLFGRGIVEPGSPAFSFSVFGLMMIGLVNVLQLRGRNDFLLLCGTVVVLYSLTWFSNHSYATTFRGLLWLAATASVAAALCWIVRHRLFARVRFGFFIVWVFCCAALYLLLEGSDLLISWLSGVRGPVPLASMALHGAKLGGEMGLGMGLGFDIARLIPERRKEETAGGAPPA